jgi:beta-lactamase class A
VVVDAIFEELGVGGAACATAVNGGKVVGVEEDKLVTPASVMKIQIALAVHNAIEAGTLDGAARRVLRPEHRTPGPVGMSLMRDQVTMSVRDLVVAMLTISDNVATDELLAVVGLDQVNLTTRRLGLARTLITSGLHDLLDSMSLEAGFADFAALSAHDPDHEGPPSDKEVTARIARSGALDPARGNRTTAAETVALLQAIWTDRAGPHLPVLRSAGPWANSSLGIGSLPGLGPRLPCTPRAAP